MIVASFRINYSYGDVIKVRPLFDVHWGNKYCDKKAFKQYLKEADDKTYFIGGGDLLDSIITKDIKRYTKHADDTTGDAVIDEQIDQIHEVLEPYKDKILGLGRGNHEAAIIKHHGSDPIRRLCRRLGCRNLGYAWLVRLVLNEDGSRVRSVVIRGHHGWGGSSRTRGGDLTKFHRDMGEWDADIYLYGHTHKKLTDEMPRMSGDWTNERLSPRDQYLAICGTYLKTLTETEDSTYSEEAGYSVVPIGGVVCNIKPLRVGVKIWIDK